MIYSGKFPSYLTKRVIRTINIAQEWNPLQAKLKACIANSGQFEEAIETCLTLHAMAHVSEMSGFSGETYEDRLWKGLNEKAFRIMPTPKDDTIAWDIWHSTRIEDLVANILIAGGRQVLDECWLMRLNTATTDTGNAMTDDEINRLSSELDMNALRDYRLAVGIRTREILKALEPSEVKRKVKPENLRRIMDEGGVIDVEGSRWLLDFWGRKNISGLLMMPITRHLAVHLNDAFRIKKRLMRG